MYYPYLHGRRSELIALRELVGWYGNPQRVTPVVEVAKITATTQSTIRITVDLLIENAVDFYLVVEPIHGASRLDLAAWQTLIVDRLTSPRLRPTILIGPHTTEAELRQFVAAFPDRPIGVSVRSAVIAPAVLQEILSGSTFLAFLHETANPSAYEASLGTMHVVVVQDHFTRQARNVDYGAPDWYSDSVRTWQATGRPGFSDYTILAPQFSEGGGQVGAVVIHGTYADPSDDLWVEHFLSDRVMQGDGTDGEKILEAAAKLKAEHVAHPGKFHLTPGLTAYLEVLESRAEIALAASKRHQMTHHIGTVAWRLAPGS